MPDSEVISRARAPMAAASGLPAVAAPRSSVTERRGSSRVLPARGQAFSRPSPAPAGALRPGWAAGLGLGGRDGRAPGGGGGGPAPRCAEPYPAGLRAEEVGDERERPVESLFDRRRAVERLGDRADDLEVMTSRPYHRRILAGHQPVPGESAVNVMHP